MIPASRGAGLAEYAIDVQPNLARLPLSIGTFSICTGILESTCVSENDVPEDRAEENDQTEERESDVEQCAGDRGNTGGTTHGAPGYFAYN